MKNCSEKHNKIYSTGTGSYQGQVSCGSGSSCFSQCGSGYSCFFNADPDPAFKNLKKLPVSYEEFSVVEKKDCSLIKKQQ